MKKGWSKRLCRLRWRCGKADIAPSGCVSDLLGSCECHLGSSRPNALSAQKPACVALRAKFTATRGCYELVDALLLAPQGILIVRLTIYTMVQYHSDPCPCAMTSLMID